MNRIEFSSPEKLAAFLAELHRQGCAYEIVNKSDGWAVVITGY